MIAEFKVIAVFSIMRDWQSSPNCRMRLVNGGSETCFDSTAGFALARESLQHFSQDQVAHGEWLDPKQGIQPI